MKILFFYENYNNEPLGIMYLSSVLKEAGHKTDFFIIGDNIELIKKIKQFKPDIIAISTTTGLHKRYMEISRMIKSSFDTFIIFGGPHPTYFPEIITEDCVDAVCIGEGEYAFLELVNNLEAGKDITKIKGIWVKLNKKIYKNPIRPLIQDLDSLPYPDRELVEKHFGKMETRHFIAIRGCPYSCTYCYNHTLKKMYPNQPFIRARSASNMIEEIKEVLNKYHFKRVMFVDDTFILNRKWLKEFSKKYKKEIGLPFHCNIRTDIFDEEVAKLLKDAGCFEIDMAIESGNEYIRNKILKRNISNEQIIKAGQIIKKMGMKLRTENMVGIPGETLQNVIETLRLNTKVNPYYAWCSIFQPYPKTELGEYAKNYLKKSINLEEINQNYHTNSVLNIKNKREMENIHKFFAICVSYPFLIPMTKILIKMPSNRFFNLIMRGYKYYCYKKSKFFK